MSEISRKRLVDEMNSSLSVMPVTTLLGSRQIGKTTLARMFTKGMKDITWYDLEVVADMRRLSSAPELELSRARGVVVIDEVQRMPELFTILRPLCDRPSNPCHFVLLGSAALSLIKGISESLAGRVRKVYMSGFSLEEVGFTNKNRLWLRGGYPRSYLLDNNSDCWHWLEDFMSSFLERDIPQLGLNIPSQALRRFWGMVAHYHGQIWNASELAKSMDVSSVTARRYLDILSGSFMLRILPPWYENLKKRQVKSPKVYLRDSGMLHLLLGIFTFDELTRHPKLGASWEGFALEQVLMNYGDRDAYFWSTQRGAELDLLLLRYGKRFGFEFKYSDAPRMTKSMHIAIEDLGLEKIYVIYPGDKSYILHEKVEVIPLQEIYRLPLNGWQVV